MQCFCINLQPNSVFQIRRLDPNENLEVQQPLTDVGSEHRIGDEATGLALVSLVPILASSSDGGLMRPVCCSVWMFIDVKANNEFPLRFLGELCRHPTRMCKYGLKKVICYD